MWRYIVNRLLSLLAMLAVAVVVTFIANRFVPGDPVLTMLGDRSNDAQMVANLRHQYGLDLPLVQQFLNYVLGLLHGDFGLSFRFPGTPASDVIGDGIAVSPIIGFGALFLAISLGLLIGAFAAARAGTLVDTAIMLIVVIGLSVPSFVLATLFVWLLSVKLGWLPVAGWGTPRQAVLPIMLAALPEIAYFARMTRTFLLETLSLDFVRTARSKGLPERIVVFRHALRNAMLPLLTVAGVLLGGLVTGTVVVENIFNIQGLGRIALTSIEARDYPVTLGIVLLFTAVYGVANFLVDLAYLAIDPRIRLGAAT